MLIKVATNATSHCVTVLSASLAQESFGKSISRVEPSHEIRESIACVRWAVYILAQIQDGLPVVQLDQRNTQCVQTLITNDSIRAFIYSGCQRNWLIHVSRHKRLIKTYVSWSTHEEDAVLAPVLLQPRRFVEL